MKKIMQELMEMKSSLKRIEEGLGVDLEDFRMEIVSAIVRGHCPSIPIEKITDEAQERGVPVQDAEKCLELLRRKGDLFEPKAGFVRRM